MSDSPEDVTAKLAELGIKEEPKEAVAETAIVEQEEPIESVASEQFSEVEQEAMKKGWKPDGPKSADEFLRAEPLYEEIKQRGKEIKTLRSQVDELMKHVGNLKKAGYESQLEKIKQERANAIARSDVASVDYYDDQLYQVKAELQREPMQPEAHPEAVRFIEKYKTELSDPAFRAWVDVQDKALAQEGLPPELHLEKLEHIMKTEFPRKFNKAEKVERLAVVESDSRPTQSKVKTRYSYADLNPQQKTIYKQLEKKGVMTGAEYIKQLVEMDQLK